MWLWTAFIALATQRQSNESIPQPIMIADIYAYSQIMEFSHAEQTLVLYIVSVLDQRMLDFIYRRMEQERRKAKTGSRKR